MFYYFFLIVIISAIDCLETLVSEMTLIRCVEWDVNPLMGKLETAEKRTIIQQYGDWYTGRRWVGCYIWYREEGPGRAAAPPSPPTSLYEM